MKYLNQDFTGQTLTPREGDYYRECRNLTFQNSVIRAVFYDCQNLTFINCQIQFAHTRLSRNITINGGKNYSTHSHEIIADLMTRYANKLSGTIKQDVLTDAQMLRDNFRWSWADFILALHKDSWDSISSMFADHPLIEYFARKIRETRWEGGRDKLVGVQGRPHPDKPLKPVRKDIILKDHYFEDAITITVDEIDTIVNNNEPEDVFGVQADIEDLIRQRRINPEFSLVIKIFSLSPFNMVSEENDSPDWWRRYLVVGNY